MPIRIEPWTGPAVVIHGGARTTAREEAPDGRAEKKAELAQIAAASYSLLAKGASAKEVALHAIHLLEETPSFNAGRGSSLQCDGQARLSASLMDGATERFSAVALVTHIIHPSALAAALQDRPNRNLGPFGAQLLARELGIKPEDPITDGAVSRYRSDLAHGSPLHGAPAGPGAGTVGAVVVDAHGRFAASTSTGGHGTDYPERMGDVATVAGNYASSFGAVSCTGVGEEIIEQGAALRIESRLRDGMSLEAACVKSYEEALAAKRRFGWIALSPDSYGVAHTTPFIYAAAASGTHPGGLILVE